MSSQKSKQEMKSEFDQWVKTVWQVADRIGEQTILHSHAHHPNRDGAPKQPDNQNRSKTDDHE